MRFSQIFSPTIKEIPSEAETISHQLMIRAGLIRKTASGVYSFLPLGLRVIEKICKIIREELNKVGGQEVLLPLLQPSELWEETGRLNIYGKELMRVKDRNDREFCLGPTHEEVITDLVRKDLKSYRELPFMLYQIGAKFRDEIRPRFGVMRAREFLMKDAYSFHKDKDNLDKYYNKVFDAYCRIFERCGLKFRAVEADPGAIGGDVSHEFMVIANTGEDVIVYCDKCDYAANLQKSGCKGNKANDGEENKKRIEMKNTPNIKTVEELTEFLNIRKEKIVKTILYLADGKVTGALIRGDREVNEIKLKNILGCTEMVMADKDTIEKITSTPVGFTGPVGLKVELIADNDLHFIKNFVTGANKEDTHYINVNIPDDFTPSTYADIKIAQENDLCERCDGSLHIMRGIEVGHIFKLEKKYSEPMKAEFLDEDGKPYPVIMGCYGIGISRTVAAAIEQSYDKDGIIWQSTIAPFDVIILPVNMKVDKQCKIANSLYNELISKGMEVLIDDRDERAGVKFKDADLIGIPLIVITGEKTKEGIIEIKERKTGEKRQINIDNAADKIFEIWKAQK